MVNIVKLIVTPSCTWRRIFGSPHYFFFFVDLELGSQLDLTFKVLSNLQISMILKFPV